MLELGFYLAAKNRVIKTCSISYGCEVGRMWKKVEKSRKFRKPVKKLHFAWKLLISVEKVEKSGKKVEKIRKFYFLNKVENFENRKKLQFAWKKFDFGSKIFISGGKILLLLENFEIGFNIPIFN